MHYPKKIKISFKLKTLTGMYIGGSSMLAAIGSVSNVIIKDSKTGLPMIPGSSLKGKMRTLLVRSFSEARYTQKWEDDPTEITRLFGTQGKKKDNVYPKAARLQFCDAFLVNREELDRRGGSVEIKVENNINRYTSMAMPRQLERAVRGSEFQIYLVYDIETTKWEEIEKDFENISHALKMLSLDYLGGQGTRGYGKVSFSNFQVEIIHDFSDEDKTKAQEKEGKLLNKLKEAENYAGFNL